MNIYVRKLLVLSAIVLALCVGAIALAEKYPDRALTGRLFLYSTNAVVIECDTNIAVNEINPQTVLVGCE